MQCQWLCKLLTLINIININSAQVGPSSSWPGPCALHMLHNPMLRHWARPGLWLTLRQLDCHYLFQNHEFEDWPMWNWNELISYETVRLPFILKLKCACTAKDILFSCLQVLRRATRRLWKKRNESERHAIVYPGTGGYYPGTAFCWCCFSDNYMFRIEVHGAETYDVTAMPWVMGHAGHCSVERRWWVTKDDPLAFGTVGAYSAVQTLGKGKGNKKNSRQRTGYGGDEEGWGCCWFCCRYISIIVSTWNSE